MRFKEKINDWSHIIFLIFCFLLLIVGVQILILPENTCSSVDNQLITRLSIEIDKENLIKPPDNPVVIGETLSCGESGGGYSGESIYPGVKKYVLGQTVGTTSIAFRPFVAPDRFILFYNNKPVLDTGFRGTPIDENGIEYKFNTIGHADRNDFIYSLKDKKDPYSNLLYPNTSIQGTMSDGYPKVIDTEGDFILTFDKYSPTITGVEVYIYAPQSTTAWEIYMGCPEE